MKKSELITALEKNPGKEVMFQGLPPYVHVTHLSVANEVRADCCGEISTQSVCTMEMWYGGDNDHRLTTDKLLGILKSVPVDADHVWWFVPDRENVVVGVNYLYGSRISEDPPFMVLLGRPRSTHCPDPSRCIKGGKCEN